MIDQLAAGRALYERHIQFLVEKDVDGLIDTNYTSDAQLVSFQALVTGRDALKAYFHGYLELLGDIVVESTDKFTATDDAILFEATVSSNLGRARVYDAWTLRDGRISHHFTGVMGT